jgi:hypothetical protein
MLWANVKWAGDDGHQSEESTHDGEELEGSSTSMVVPSLSFSFSHFVFSSIGAANIYRITWANVKRAGDDGTNSLSDGKRSWMNCFVFSSLISSNAAVDVSVSATIFSRLRANIGWVGDMGQESR